MDRAADPFPRAHDLIREGALDEALGLVLEPLSDEINREYRGDENHAWYVVGEILLRMGDLARSRRAFLKAVALDPEDYQAMWAIGNVSLDLGEAAEGEAWFRRALFIGMDIDQLTYNLANALFDQRRFEEAAELYRTIHSDDPELWRLVRANLDLAESRSHPTGRVVHLKQPVRPGFPRRK